MARFTNQAQLRYGDEVTNSNIVVGEIRETYGQRDNVTYIISIVNSGQTAFTGATLEDDLGEYDFGERELTPLTYIPGTIKYYIDGVLQPTPVVTAGPPLTVSGLTIPA